MSTKAYFVYILKNRMNRRFIGITENPDNELSLHNSGKFKGTKQFKPWQMEWISSTQTRNDSIRLEGALRHHKTNTDMIYTVIHDHELKGLK